MQGYYAIDDIDIRDNYCGTNPANAVVNNLTTPSPATVRTPTSPPPRHTPGWPDSQRLRAVPFRPAVAGERHAREDRRIALLRTEETSDLLSAVMSPPE